MLSLLILFLVISSLAAVCISMSSTPRHVFEEYLPVACSGIVLILFFFGLLGILRFGVFFILILSALFYIISIRTIIHKKSYISFCKSYFSPGFVVFCLLYVALTVLNYGRVASSWDEFSHWADVVKAMYIIDDFSTSKLSNSGFQSYMPGMALFQYFFQKIHQITDAYSGFSEWRLYLSYQIFACSFFFPCLKYVSYKNILMGVFLFTLAVLSPSILFTHYFPISLYIDAFVGIVIGSGFAALYINRSKDTFTYISLLLTLATLVLSKDVGLMFAIFLVIAIIGDEFFFASQNRNRADLKSSLRFFVVSISSALTVFGTKSLWNHNIIANNARKSFSAPIEFDVLWDVLSGADRTYRSVVKKNYIHALFNEEQIFGYFLHSLTWPVIFLILIGMLFCIHFIYQAKLAESRNSRRVIILVIVIQTLVYIIGLGVLYLFRFSDYEAVRLASFNRYLSIAALAIFITSILLSLSCLFEYPAHVFDVGVIFLTVLLMGLPMENLRPFLNRWSVNYSISHREGYQSAISHMLDIVQNDQKRIYIVSQESSGLDELVLKYCLRPCIVTGDSLSPDGPLYEGDIWTSQITVEEWKEVLKDFDYVITFKVDDLFIKNYGSVFENTEDVVNQAIFSINHDTGLLTRCW